MSMQPTPAVYHPPSCDPSFQRRGEPYGYASPVIGRPPLQHHWSAPGAFRLPPNPRSASPATASAAQVQQPPSQFERPVGFSERRRACPTSLPAPLQLTSRSYRGPPSPYYAVHEFSAGPAPPLPGPASASLEHRQREWTATTSASTTAGMSSRRTAQDYGAQEDYDEEFDDAESGPLEDIGESVLRLGNRRRQGADDSFSLAGDPSNKKKKGNGAAGGTSAPQQRLLSEAPVDEDGNTIGRRKIQIEYIQDRARRHITFSKRKAGIMKKAYELSTLTGTQVLLLVASEAGTVYTYTTEKLEPIVQSDEGKDLIRSCLDGLGNDIDTPPPSASPVLSDYDDQPEIVKSKPTTRRTRSIPNLRKRSSGGNLGGAAQQQQQKVNHHTQAPPVPTLPPQWMTSPGSQPMTAEGIASSTPRYGFMPAQYPSLGPEAPPQQSYCGSEAANTFFQPQSQEYMTASPMLTPHPQKPEFLQATY